MTVSDNLRPQAASSTGGGREFLVFRMLWMRGVCVLGVIVIHVGGVVRLADTINWLTPLVLLAIALARFAVPIFIILSGFYLSLNPRNERPESLYKRTMPPLLVSYGVYSTLYVLASFRSGHLSWQSWFWALSSGTANGTLWFIPVIIELYLLHPLLRRMYRRTASGIRFVLGALLVQMLSGLVGEMARAEASAHGWLRMAGTLLGFLPYVGYFAFGYLLLDRVADVPQLVGRPKTRMASAMVWICGAAVLTLWSAVPLIRAGSWSAPNQGLALSLLSIPIGLGALALLIYWSPGAWLPRPVNRVVQVCGLYAFGVYYLHPAALLFTSVVLTKYLGLDWTEPGFYVLAYPSVVGISVLLVKVVARLPFTRYLA